MLTAITATGAMLCGVFGYTSYKERTKLKDKKAEFLSTIIPSDTMNPDNVPQGKQFILRHIVPHDDVYKLIQVNVEKHFKRIVRSAKPHVSTRTNYDVVTVFGLPLVIPTQTTYVSPDVLVIHEKEVNETRMEEVAFYMMRPDFGLTFCGDPLGFSGILPRLVIDRFSLFPFRQQNDSNPFTFPYKTEIGDYGSVRDALKQYNCNLTLNNVGTVCATIADCSGQTLYFNVVRNGTKLSYDCIATSPLAIADDKFDKFIEDETLSVVLSVVGFVACGIATCVSLVK